MVSHTSDESGLEELQRLSRGIEDWGKELARELRQARQSIELVERKRALWAVIREYKISMVLETLEPLATFEISKEVKSLKDKYNTDGLRRIITGEVEEIQKMVNASAGTPAEIADINKKLKLLSILLELLFYIE
jgi:hypothetical protein